MTAVGAVYAIQVGGSVKIGFTQNLRACLKRYGYTSGRARLLALTDCPDSSQQRTNPLRLERDWHQQAAPYRVHGEWYWPAPELLASLCSHGIDANLLSQLGLS